MFLEGIKMASPASRFGVRMSSQSPEIRLHSPLFLDQQARYVMCMSAATNDTCKKPPANTTSSLPKDLVKLLFIFQKLVI